ncbi:hypothetical protein RF11_14863 [Thelohanellus kitauei]|uniref:Uncharacterized protein n=1 Tax=Thelohanellus kitauei TaxID=669202 RepID=A0A0C2N2E5_THEKT|nr:hypothetical protein RF11_14863 [Thelohanellus kitauei]
MSSFNYNNENKSNCLLLMYMSRTFLVQYDPVTNLKPSYSKFVEMTIQIINDNQDNDDKLLTLYLTGWREICPENIPSPVMIPSLLYDPSWGEFSIKFYVDDITYGYVEYRCSLNDRSTILTEYYFRELYVERCMQTIFYYGKNQAIRIFENIPHQDVSVCKQRQQKITGDEFQGLLHNDASRYFA